jgi:protein TonB
VRFITAADARPPGSDPLPGSSPAYSGSLIVHAVLLASLMLVSGQPAERESTHESADDRTRDLTTLVWMPASGAAGGGGGGNRNPDPPRRLQRIGTDRSSTPAIVRTVLGPVQPEPIEPTIVVPSLVPLAGGSMILPGALDPAAFPGVSLGPGTGAGAQNGNGGGIGSGNGSGLDQGSGGNFGGGLRGPGAGSVRPPTVVRNVRPQYTTEAMRARIQGAVLVAAIVEADGTVRDARVVRSLDPVFGLDQSALRAARDWLFRPATMDGKPVALAVTIELVFSLR